MSQKKAPRWRKVKLANGKVVQVAIVKKGGKIKDDPPAGTTIKE